MKVVFLLILEFILLLCCVYLWPLEKKNMHMHSINKWIEGIYWARQSFQVAALPSIIRKILHEMFPLKKLIQFFPPDEFLLAWRVWAHL